jgi:hypothetical protein
MAALLGSCGSTTTVSTVQDLSPSADVPYKKVLVIALFAKFDTRRYLEKEVVAQLKARGIDAVASTSMMDTRTPVTRPTFVAMVDRIGADAVLVTQLVDLETASKAQTMNPQATRNIRPTYYYNVWTYELTEYEEPDSVKFKHSLRLATQLLSVRGKDTVWAIESKSRVVEDLDHLNDYSLFVDEAKAIVTQMSRDGLIAR